MAVGERKRRADDVEVRALAVIEIAMRSIEHEADQRAVVNMERNGDRVRDADALVVLAIQRRAAKRRRRKRVRNAVCAAVLMRRVVAHKRM